MGKERFGNARLINFGGNMKDREEWIRTRSEIISL